MDCLGCLYCFDSLDWFCDAEQSCLFILFVLLQWFILTFGIALDCLNCLYSSDCLDCLMDCLDVCTASLLCVCVCLDCFDCACIV